MHRSVPSVSTALPPAPTPQLGRYARYPANQIRDGHKPEGRHGSRRDGTGPCRHLSGQCPSRWCWTRISLIVRDEPFPWQSCARGGSSRSAHRRPPVLGSAIAHDHGRVSLKSGHFQPPAPGVQWRPSTNLSTRILATILRPSSSVT